MTLGEKIKIARQQKKMSQIDLSKLAGTHQKNISKYEQNLVIPSAVVLKNIANALGVTADYLLNDENDVQIKDKELLRKFEAIQNMNGETKKVVDTFLDLIIRDYKAKQAYTQ